MKRLVTLLLALVALTATLTAQMRYETLVPTETYGGKYGYTNPYGRMMIKPRYDYAGSFFDGLAAVEIAGKWGYINMKGKVVVKLEYQYASDFYHGYGIVKKDGKFGAVNAQGVLDIPCEYDRIDDLLNLKVVRLTPEQVEKLRAQEQR